MQKKRDIQEERQVRSSRLKECMKAKQVTQAELIRRYEKKTEMRLYRQNLSSFLNGGRGISDYELNVFAEILNIYPEFLLGDQPMCETYAEYKEYKHLLDKDPAFGKFNRVFFPAGLLLTATTDDYSDNGSLIYSLGLPKGKFKHFTEKEMQAFYDGVLKMIRNLFEGYTTEEDIYSCQDPEQFKKFLEWHSYLEQIDIERIIRYNDFLEREYSKITKTE